MADDFKKLSEDELNAISGGAEGKVGLDYDGPWKVVANLQSGWLALRTRPVYDYNNEIGRLYNGDRVQIIGNGSGLSSDGQSYVWVYAERINKSGWVNDKFLA